MLDQTQINKLTFLTNNITRCRICKRICKNGIAIPYWSKKSKFMIMAEAPGFEEIKEENQTPLVGRAGRFLFGALNKYGLERDDFLILNTIQHRPVENGRNGKPREGEIENCRFWVSKYIQVLDPEFIIAFGNYSLYYFFKENSGIMKQCGSVREWDGRKIIPCIHPASVLYNPENKKLFMKATKRFKKEMQNG